MVLPQGLEEELVATIGLDVLCALEYMHSRGRIHRDVKARPPALRPARLAATCRCCREL